MRGRWGMTPWLERRWVHRKAFSARAPKTAREARALPETRRHGCKKVTCARAGARPRPGLAPCRAEDRGLTLQHQVKLLLDNLPSPLASERETLAACLRAMNRAAPLRCVYLFGSHARGEARPDSDVGLVP